MKSMSENDLGRELVSFYQDEKSVRFLFENLVDAFAHLKMQNNSEGKPVDYVFLEVNRAGVREIGAFLQT